MSTWSPRSAFIAGAPLWNGTPTAWVFNSTLNTYSLPMRADDPPNPKLKGFPFDRSTNSAKVRAGLLALTASAMLSRAANAIGASSSVE
jgi:hypothetical protein